VLWKVLTNGRGKHSRAGTTRNDELLGHHGDDTIDGGAGNDVLWGDWDPANNNGSQRDVLRGGAGKDWLYTSHGRNTISGGAGDDHVWAFYGHGTIDCGAGYDVVRVHPSRHAYRLRGCEKLGSGF
jgi:Ca2+-binding RTX toxin-like protein